jgi:hypothetical protein
LRREVIELSGDSLSSSPGSILTAVNLRFAVKIPVEFREAGSKRWLMGYTEDMGSTGVLFRAGEWVQPSSKIEMIFRLPVQNPCDLVCKGVVLRVDLPAHAGLLPTIAATIENYKFVRHP